MKPRNVKKNMIGGALVGSLLGTLSALLSAKQRKTLAEYHVPDWAQKAKDIGEKVYDEVRGWTHPEHNKEGAIFVKGALLGLLLGAGSALLLTPKTGDQLRRNLAKGYKDLANKTQQLIENADDVKRAIIRKSPARKTVKKIKRKAK